MKNLLFLGLLLCALGRPLPASALTYYMSPSGSESNDGRSANTSWITPNHSGLLCGDVILAAAGQYPAITVTTTPSCRGHNAVFVTCAVFAQCKIVGSQTQGGILVQASHWSFMGWEVSTPAGSSAYASCFQATPGDAGPIHDIYFINDIANGCQAGGFTASNAVDYFAAVADIAWNAAQNSPFCYSGFSVYQPVASDTLPGTHIYLSQLFAWHNVDPGWCQNGPSIDGEGVILDTFNGAQGHAIPYTQQAVVENVIAVFNGAGGILEGGSGNSGASIYIRHNTAFGNFIDPTQNARVCGQIESVGSPADDRSNKNVNTQLFANLAVVPTGGTAVACGAHPAYAYFVGNVDATTLLYVNAGFSSDGNNVGQEGLIDGFFAGPTNFFGVDPIFANPVEPPAPNCTGKANVIDCVAAMIAGFRPTKLALSSFGYQPPRTAIIYDPLFQTSHRDWLRGVVLWRFRVQTRQSNQTTNARLTSLRSDKSWVA